jgi:alkanesulfonate monooxygenase SsuD/methylene tetrahydromethanopterin reductase-like flavin-dependent oxidoreductase (luciferase family)
MAPLHVFLRTASAQVAALSRVDLPECFARVSAADLQAAQRQSARLRDGQGCTVFVDVEVLVDSDVRTAMRAAEELGPGSALRYVGTPRGLAGFIEDIHTLGIADGVTLHPLRAVDNAERMINDVLPMLGLDIAQLAA